MLRLRNQIWLLSIAVIFGSAGCGRESVSIPDTPDGTVKAVIGGLAKHDLRYVWAALPDSYQADVTGLVRDFANAVDQEVYDESVNLVQRVLRLLKSKKTFILNHPMTKDMLEEDRVSANWDSFIGLFETLVNGECSSVSSLKKLDVEEYLAGTGAEFMRKLAEVSKMSPEDPLAVLQGVSVVLVESTLINATVEVTVPGKPTKKINLSKIDKKWLPSEMAAEWPTKIREARKKLAKMAADKKSYAASATRGLAMANMIVGQIEEARTQEEFDELLSGWLGAFARPR